MERGGDTEDSRAARISFEEQLEQRVVTATRDNFGEEMAERYALKFRFCRELTELDWGGAFIMDVLHAPELAQEVLRRAYQTWRAEQVAPWEVVLHERPLRAM